MVRVAILGAGAHSWHSHGPALRHFEQTHPGQVALVAVCDLDRDKAQADADSFGFRRMYCDVEKMLAETRPECLLAATPINRTREISGRLLAVERGHEGESKR